MTEGHSSTRDRRWFKVLVVVVLAVWWGGSLLFMHESVATTRAIPTADKVVIFGIPALTLDDLSDGTMPHLAALTSRGVVAAANVRGGGKGEPSIAEAYATLGAGYRIDSGDTGTVAKDVSGSGAGSVRVPDMPGPTSDGDRSEDGKPGAMADALRQAGKATGVVSNADVVLGGRRLPAGPAALAAADSQGLVSTGTVGTQLTVRSPVVPGGLATSRDAFLGATARALDTADLVVVDSGATTRWERVAGPMTGPRSLHSALKATDDLVGALAQRLGPRTVMIVVGMTPPGSTWQLTPVVMVGTQLAPGHLKSPSTHRRDLVTVTDIAPTALALLGEPTPTTMTGHVLRIRPGGTGLANSRAFNDMLVSRRGTDQPLTLVFILVQSALYAVGVVMLIRRRLSSRLGEVLMYAVLTCAAWPLATFLIRASLALSSLGTGTGVLTWMIAAAVAAVATRFRAHPLDPLMAICGATVATIVLDMSTGAHLQYGSFFGYAPNKGTRFTGLGNAAFALLASSCVVVVTALVARARRSDEAWWGAVAIAAAVVAADGSPWMGADVGGILSLVPILVLLLWALRGHPVRWRHVGVAALAALAVMAAAVGLDALRAPDQRTHLSRFFLNLGDWGMVRSTITTKWSANVRLLRESMWAWLVPITVALSLIALAVGRLWERALPPGSVQRYGVMATLALALLGWLLNDSGIVVVALTSVFIGPYVLLVARSNEVSGDEGALVGAASTEGGGA